MQLLLLNVCSANKPLTCLRQRTYVELNKSVITF